MDKIDDFSTGGGRGEVKPSLGAAFCLLKACQGKNWMKRDGKPETEYDDCGAWWGRWRGTWAARPRPDRRLNDPGAVHGAGTDHACGAVSAGTSTGPRKREWPERGDMIWFALGGHHEQGLERRGKV